LRPGGPRDRAQGDPAAGEGDPERCHPTSSPRPTASSSARTRTRRTTEPESLVLAFVALDDTDRANGCLEVVPGSHRQGLKRVLRMTANGFEPVGASGNDDPRPRDLLRMGRGVVAHVLGRAQHATWTQHYY